MTVASVTGARFHPPFSPVSSLRMFTQCSAGRFHSVPIALSESEGLEPGGSDGYAVTGRTHA